MYRLEFQLIHEQKESERRTYLFNINIIIYHTVSNLYTVIYINSKVAQLKTQTVNISLTNNLPLDRKKNRYCNSDCTDLIHLSRLYTMHHLGRLNLQHSPQLILITLYISSVWALISHQFLGQLFTLIESLTASLHAMFEVQEFALQQLGNDNIMQSLSYRI